MKPSVSVPGFRPYIGQHCETVATGSLLAAAGIELSEPMLFGLGEGLGFIFINLGSLPLPFVGGRVKPFALTTALCKNLGVHCDAVETTSKSRSWTVLERSLSQGLPVGLQLDCYHLEYFSRPVHFAGHFVAAHGFDADHVYVVDTEQQGSGLRVKRENLEAARFAKGPMAAKARSWTIAPPGRAGGSGKASSKTGSIAIGKATRDAIRANARDYLSPGFKGASYLGIRKLAASLPGWSGMASDPARDLELAALLMQKAGTGGSLFRNFYRDFLLEAREHLAATATLKRAHEAFATAAEEWEAVARLIEEAGRRADAAPLRDAATRCLRIADVEFQAMRLLAAI
jgi:hypothetical protein